ncbi:MAG: transposase [Clostridium sp.]|uniref:RNA-guided endonuclease InsQ/TnpB family protein n=1 Tax=Clostridium sp. TaxID=1506 RepID=UPI0025BB832E|nr:transposase [Clostridium sp.]MCE5220216.1 transposase [Clostridium sp.]
MHKTHPLYKVIDEFSFRSKNLYNYANYLIRQEFINNGKYIKYRDIDKMLQKTEPYKELMSQSSQCTLQVLDRNWKSFFVAIKDWSKNPSKYLGRPKLPKYKKKDGRFPWYLKNNQTWIKDGYLGFQLKVMNGYKFKTNVKGRLISVRFIPKGSIYIMEIVYEIEVPEVNPECKNIIGIDLGVNNFVTIVNNIGLKPIIINGKGIKSINQYYNKRKAKTQSELKIRHNKDWSNKLDILTRKRANRVKNYIHHTSHYIIEYCKDNQIDTIVLGLNKTWKQECKMNDKTTQNFIYIPYNMLINQLKYKSNDNNINLIITEEAYTSGTSFLDNELPIKENYNKSRRIKRGLFKSNDGRYINSDVNGACQIMRKVFPKAMYGIEGSLTPVIINVTKVT